jgi:hypothetical protein
MLARRKQIGHMTISIWLSTSSRETYAVSRLISKGMPH